MRNHLRREDEACDNYVLKSVAEVSKESRRDNSEVR